MVYPVLVDEEDDGFVPICPDSGQLCGACWYPYCQHGCHVRSSILTVRQVQVAMLVADGLKNGDICDRLGINVKTLKTHMQTIYQRLGIVSGDHRVRLARWVLCGGLGR